MKVLLLLAQIIQNYLLMDPIQASLQKRNFRLIEENCRPNISINLETPLLLKGYLPRRQFVETFSRIFSSYTVDRIEWASIGMEENVAVQSLNMILKNPQTGQLVYYKLFFFLSREREWKIFYLRGIRI